MRISDWSSDVCSSVYDVPVEPTGRECRAPHRRRGEAVGDRQLMSSLLIEDRDHVRILTLSRPQRRNAIDQALHEELSRAFDEIESDSAVRAAVLTGGPSFFCEGPDIALTDTPRTEVGGHYGYPERARRTPPNE